MKPEAILQIARNDQAMQAQIDNLKATWDADPEKLKMMIAATNDFIRKLAMHNDQIGYGPGMMAARMAMLGMFLVFEETSQWEEGT